MEIDIQEFYQDFPYEIGSDLKFIEKIGRGAFGTVLHVFDKKLNKDISVKVISKTKRSPSYINKIKEEISILKKLNHPNIVKFYGFLETNNQLLVKMEYIKHGTLKQWMKTREKISEEEASTILRKILTAIEYLHSKQICHRDLKPENIMLSKENDLNSIKIVDFGLSTQNSTNLINNDYCGTYIYMAPELIEKKLYFISIDIWSIGILMFMLLNKGKHPFYIKGDMKERINDLIKNGNLKFYEKVTPLAKHLIQKLLEPNPSWRYTASQAIRHPWITRNLKDTPPKTFNELISKSNNKKILKDLFITCLLFNYFHKKENFTYLTNNNCKKFLNEDNFNDEDEKNKFIDDKNIFESKFKEKTIPIVSRNRLPKGLKYTKFFKEKKYSISQIIKNKNIFSLMQKPQIKKLNPYKKVKRQNSNSTIDSKPLISSYRKLKEKKRSNSIDSDYFTPIKKSDYSINQSKINEECKIKITKFLQKNKNAYRHLSDKKLRYKLPSINLKYPLKHSFIINYKVNSNLVPVNLPSLNYSAQAIKKY